MYLSIFVLCINHVSDTFLVLVALAACLYPDICLYQQQQGSGQCFFLDLVSKLI